MTCAVTMTDAMASAVSVSWPHQATNQPSPFVPAENTENGQSSDGTMRFIASRCKRLRHANNVQRMRWLAVHQILSKAFGVSE